MKALEHGYARWHAENYLRLLRFYFYLNLCVRNAARYFFAFLNLALFVLLKVAFAAVKLFVEILLLEPHEKGEHVENWIYRHYK